MGLQCVSHLLSAYTGHNNPSMETQLNLKSFLLLSTFRIQKSWQRLLRFLSACTVKYKHTLH